MSNRLNAGDPPLTTGNQLTSTNGLLNLIMQGDGNLVLYRTTFGIPLWASNTSGPPGVEAVMQGDGNLVVYSAAGVALFASNTDGHQSAFLLLQDDGNLVIYDGANGGCWRSRKVTTSDHEM